MSIFCKHQWKTTDNFDSKTYPYDRDEDTLPKKIVRIIEQQCKKCGVQKVRKFRI